MRNHMFPGLTVPVVGVEPAKRRWRTPPWLLDEIRAEFGAFALDAAADECNAVAPRWIDRQQDCLTTEWGPLADGGLVWFNPPYGARAKACPVGCAKDHVHHTYDFPGTGAFVARAIDQAARYRLRVAMLLESATDAGWWRIASRECDEARLLPRIAFCDEQGVAMGNPAGSNTLFVLDGSRTAAGRIWCWDVAEGAR